MTSPYGDADMTNTDGSGYAPSTTPPRQKLKDTLGKAMEARRKKVSPKKPRQSHEPETPWNGGT